MELHVAGGASVRDVRPALPALAHLATGSDVERTVTSDGDLVLRADLVVSDLVHRALEGVA